MMTTNTTTIIMVRIVPTQARIATRRLLIKPKYRPVAATSADLEQVCRTRNELERRGHNPLLFFLKCLEADDARLPELIRDESKARTFVSSATPAFRDVQSRLSRKQSTTDYADDEEVRQEFHELLCSCVRRESLPICACQPSRGPLESNRVTTTRRIAAESNHDYSVCRLALCFRGASWPTASAS